MKLISYRDLCDAMIPITAEMMAEGLNDQAIRILETLPKIPEVSLREAVKENCKTYTEKHCAGCEFDGTRGECIAAGHGELPEEWE